ncbi:Presilphiperfolan-8-beta-ol synthase [Daldinia childiae]|uniref:Presilphiperfolan-8-beta-ol synthase n=1 Tax=Daldinia childiae TaxID=326645 RepID=UPI0014464C78|nr:Presilphiperfolan-8-beta-ol synthase [Daldinia childiae]KAF3067021.1 Presilphiperfolan-8-beta-ol synthase [Daldinia childiae]
MAGSSKPDEQHGERRSVRIPDLFSSIMASKLVVNPNYSEVKAEGDEFIARIMNMDKKTNAKNRKVDFGYIGAIWVPDADKDSLKVLFNWCYWLFFFDDQFDEGHLKDDPVAAQEEVDETMAIMQEDVPLIDPHENPIRHLFQLCWLWVKQRAPLELQQQYRKQHKIYFDQIVVQSQQVAKGEVLGRDVQAYLEVRLATIAVYPAITLVQCVQGVDLPERVASHNSLQECIQISAELTLMTNDILSYRKDVELGVDHNLIPLLVEQGMSVQQAIDKIGAMVDNCYKRWYTALAELPSYGEKVDRQVLLFVEICRNIPLGNLHWSFKTSRYLGSEEAGQNVRETRILHLP